MCNYNTWSDMKSRQVAGGFGRPGYFSSYTDTQYGPSNSAKAPSTNFKSVNLPSSAHLVHNANSGLRLASGGVGRSCIDGDSKVINKVKVGAAAEVEPMDWQ